MRLVGTFGKRATRFALSKGEKGVSFFSKVVARLWKKRKTCWGHHGFFSCAIFVRELSFAVCIFVFPFFRDVSTRSGLLRAAPGENGEDESGVCVVLSQPNDDGKCVQNAESHTQDTRDSKIMLRASQGSEKLSRFRQRERESS